MDQTASVVRLPVTGPHSEMNRRDRPTVSARNLHRPGPYGLISVAATAATQALQRIASERTDAWSSVLRVHVRAEHQSARVPHPTNHPPCKFAQTAKSGGANQSAAGRFSARRNIVISSAKHSTEKS